MAVFESEYNYVQVPENLSFPQYYLQEAEKYGHREALVCPVSNVRYTYAQVNIIIKRLTAGLEQFGIEKGDRIASCLSSCPEFAFFTFAAHRLGATIIGCNPAYTYDELLHQFTDSRPVYLLTQLQHFGHVKAFRQSLPFLKQIIITDAKENAEDVEDFISLQSIMALASGREDAEHLPQINPRKDLAFILYSSGTTGLPKGVMISQYAFVCNTITYLNMTGGPPARMPHKNDRFLNIFPFFHAGGIATLFFCLFAGTTTVTMDKYEPRQFLRLAQDEMVTSIIVPPPVLVFLAKSPLVAEYKLDKLKTVFVGAAPVPKDVALEVTNRLKLKHIVQCLDMYGLTESAVLTHFTPLTREAENEKFGSAGIMIPNLKCKVVDVESLTVLNANQMGEIWIKTPSVMNGYLNNPAATKAAITEDKWLRTGDLGYCDSDGYMYVVDRLKEMIKVRGFQVAPAELENLLLQHPAVAEVAVVGVFDPYSGEVPRAYVVLKENHSATEYEIKESLHGKVARYKQLNGGVRFVTQLPKTGSGKLLRRELRDKARAESRL